MKTKFGVDFKSGDKILWRLLKQVMGSYLIDETCGNCGAFLHNCADLWSVRMLSSHLNMETCRDWGKHKTLFLVFIVNTCGE